MVLSSPEVKKSARMQTNRAAEHSANVKSVCRISTDQVGDLTCATNSTLTLRHA